MKPLGLYAIHFRILTIVRLCFSNVFGRFFRLKIVSLLSFAAKTRPGSFISQRAVAFKSGPDAKKRPALKCSSANQIASFSLIKNIYIYTSFLVLSAKRGKQGKISAKYIVYYALSRWY
jgi:hypothetical protein